MEKSEDEKMYSLIAESVRAELIRAAIEGYEGGATDGLCPSGATEAAIAAMQRVDLSTIIKRVLSR